MSPRRDWTRNELLVALDLYCRTPFGQLYAKNPKIVEVSKSIGRTPSAIAMKACNFASFDPSHRARGVKGLPNVSKADHAIWEEFTHERTWEEFAADVENAKSELVRPERLRIAEEIVPYEPDRLTETEAVRRVRLAQSFFRDAVLCSYSDSCSFCGIDLKPLLIASHIIPWSEDPYRRADPTNGISLCALHDKAFDRGLVTIDESLRIVLSRRIRESADNPVIKVAFTSIEGEGIRLPQRFVPDSSALDYHREKVFSD